jgi:hypothetical protein
MKRPPTLLNIFTSSQCCMPAPTSPALPYPCCLFFVNISFVTQQTLFQCCIICTLACMLTDTIIWWKVLYKSVSNYCKTELPWVLEQYKSSKSYKQWSLVWWSAYVIKWRAGSCETYAWPWNVSVCLVIDWVDWGLGSALMIYHHPHSAPSRVLNCKMEKWVRWSRTSKSSHPSERLYAPTCNGL